MIGDVVAHTTLVFATERSVELDYAPRREEYAIQNGPEISKEALEIEWDELKDLACVTVAY